MLSGTAQSMGQLIAMRTIQGLGAGAVAPIVLTLAGRHVQPRGAGADPGTLQRGLGPLEHRGAADRRLADGQPELALGLLRERPVRGRGLSLMLAWYVHERVEHRTVAPIDWAGAGLLTAGLSSLLLIVLDGASLGLTLNLVLAGLTVAAPGRLRGPRAAGPRTRSCPWT